MASLTGRGRRGLAVALGLASISLPGLARANGRMPGATDLAVSAADPAHLVVRTTFGLVQTRDAGKTWTWRCEQALGVSGESDPPVALLPDGGLLLLSRVGGALLSRDGACTFTPISGATSGRRCTDLTVSPSDPSHVLVVASTVAEVSEQGVVTYENLVLETRDAGATWTESSPLRSDFVVETVEVAASEPDRIYVSGTASSDALTGIVERSDDGGLTWTRSTLTLPQGSGSLFVSGVHPTDPDRVWVRVPARGDVFGFFPTTLLASTDGARTFGVVAGTERAMFGFALSPDGEQVAYGGPGDGLFVGPSDGTAFNKVSDLRVRCLEWTATGLHACASEPGDPFTIGVSAAADGAFTPLYRAADTCPAACTGASLDGGVATDATDVCAVPWTGVAPAIGASLQCGAVADAGPLPSGDASPDATPDGRDADSDGPPSRNTRDTHRSSASCGCGVSRTTPSLAKVLLALGVGALVARRRLT